MPKFVILDRGYIGHEHLQGVALINMNGRLYDARLHRFLSPDNYIQDPYGTQNFNRYGYALNNPLVYVDQNGEAWWLIPIIGAAIFGVGNVAAHAIKGDIDNVGDALKYFGQGALVGGALGMAWQFAPLIPYFGQAVQTTMTWYAGSQLVIGGLGMIGGAINGGWTGLANGAKAFLGNFYLDENNWLGGAANGFLRHT